MADETIMNAMLKAGHKAQNDWERNHIRKLPTLTTIKAIKGFRQGQKKVLAEKQECAFNVLEAFVSAVGMGDDINAIIRTCPAPRDGESELACQVNGGILGAWVGNLATKLALAASNCAITLNVDAVCSAGVTGLVSAMGEIAAGASLGAATCAPTPPIIDHHQDQRVGRSDGARASFAHWRGGSRQWRSVWCGCRYGGQPTLQIWG